MTTITQIVIADDHQLFREGLEFIIKKNKKLQLVASLAHGKELLEKLEQLAKVAQLPDIVLMDIQMPQMDGWECTQQIKQHYPHLKVIILSMFNKDDFVIHALNLGVNGYIPKHSSFKTLQEAIMQVSEKGYYFDDFTSKIMLEGLRKKNNSKPKLESEIRITPREKEVLDLILKEYTNAEIAQQLFVSVRTIETHRKHLLEKFGVKNTVGLVLRALDLGIITT